MNKRILLATFLALGIVVVFGAIFKNPLLNSISRNLVYGDTLEKCEAIVVLAGGSGNRIEAAVKLYHEGYGERLFFSGFKIYQGIYTSTVMKKYALKLGIPENNIVMFNPDVEVSTRGESEANLDLLKKYNIRKFILVTSAFHTKRAKLIYENSILSKRYDMELLIYPAPDPFVPIEGWWEVRTAQKNIFLEYIKLIAYFVT